MTEPQWLIDIKSRNPELERMAFGYTPHTNVVISERKILLEALDKYRAILEQIIAPELENTPYGSYRPYLYLDDDGDCTCSAKVKRTGEPLLVQHYNDCVIGQAIDVLNWQPTDK